MLPLGDGNNETLLHSIHYNKTFQNLVGSPQMIHLYTKYSNDCMQSHLLLLKRNIINDELQACKNSVTQFSFSEYDLTNHVIFLCDYEV